MESNSGRLLPSVHFRSPQACTQEYTITGKIDVGKNRDMQHLRMEEGNLLQHHRDPVGRRPGSSLLPVHRQSTAHLPCCFSTPHLQNCSVINVAACESVVTFYSSYRKLGPCLRQLRINSLSRGLEWKGEL